MEKKFIFKMIGLLFLLNISSIFCNNDETGKFDRDDEFFINLDFKSIKRYEDKTFEEDVKRDKPLLLYVYSSNCPECQRFVKDFIEASEYAKEEKMKMTFARMNGADNLKFSMDYFIEEYPAILYFDENKKVTHFKYEPNQDNIIRFINKKVNGDVIRCEEFSDVLKIVKNKGNKRSQVFLLSTMINFHTNDSFIRYAEENDQIIYITCQSVDCYNEYNEDAIIMKNFDERVVRYSNDYKSGAFKMTMEKLTKFMNRYIIEAGVELEKEHFKISRDNNKTMLIYFRDSKDMTQAGYDHLIKEMGIEFRKKNVYTFVADIRDKEIFHQCSQSLVISPQELPTLLYIENINVKEKSKSKTYRITNIKEENLNKEFITKFVDDIQKNKGKVDLKTQFPPEKDARIPYKIVVGRTYDREVIEEKNNVLVTFVNRKSKCELCQKYLDFVKRLAKNYKKKDVIFAIVDGSSNEARDITFTEEDLPFIYIYRSDLLGRTKVKFTPKAQGELFPGELESFINENIEGYKKTDL